MHLAGPDHPERKSLFAEGDLRLFRITAVLSAGILLTGLIVFIIWILGWIMSYLSNLIIPLSVAGVLALVLYPVVDFLEHRIGIPRVLAISILFLVAVLALGAFLVVVMPKAIQQGRDFIEAIPEMLRSWQIRLEMLSPNLDSTLASWAEQANLETFIPGLGGAAGQFMSYVGMLVGMAFLPLYLFFALLSGNRLQDNAQELLSVFSPETQTEVLYLGEVFVGYVTAFFRGQLLIAMIMGGLLAIGFTLIGLQAAIIFGVILGLLNIVPFLGVILGLISVLPVAYFQPGGGLQMVAMAFAVFAVVQLIESWLLTPKIMADRSGLHPAVVVISIFFWGTVLGGIIGMILAVPLTAFVVTLWRHLKYRFTRTVVSDTPEHPGREVFEEEGGILIPPAHNRHTRDRPQ